MLPKFHLLLNSFARYSTLDAASSIWPQNCPQTNFVSNYWLLWNCLRISIGSITIGGGLPLRFWSSLKMIRLAEAWLQVWLKRQGSNFEEGKKFLEKNILKKKRIQVFSQLILLLLPPIDEMYSPVALCKNNSNLSRQNQFFLQTSFSSSSSFLR